ncbi:MAG: GGDEF domain [Thermodesulfobacterium sp.]|uniref:GGDEF domain n=1 Tax=Candidatus Thermodesulfobacterium syntrophicum TaxID=3060442 RepID=A0AAE3P3B6_9BACT|nr:GGDEF domain [Candidatus Thermodesulfobacterium syntrophicum]
MDLLEWKELALGIKKIDEQHKRLSELVELFYSGQKIGYSKEKLDKILDELIKLIIEHSSTEEALMERTGYPGFEKHKREHEFIKRKIAEILTKRKKGKEYLVDTLGFFEKAIYEHFKNVDRDFINFLNDKLKEYQSFKRDILESIGERILSKNDFLKLLSKYTTFLKEAKLIAVILLDIDDFIEINFQYGFEIGDTILENFGVYLKNKLVHPKIFLGKAEKDEFLIAFCDCTFVEALDLIENIMDWVKKYEFKYKGEVIKFSVSLGVAFYPQDGETISELLGACEMALKMAKNKGKNTWEIFNKEFIKESKEIIRIKKLLEKAISEKRVLPYVQPIFDSEKRKIAGFEVLLRIVDENGKVIKAGEIIEIANEKGYIDKLEEIVLEKINNEKILKLFRNRYLFINKTLRGAKKINILIEEVEILKEMVEKYEVYPVIEITEYSFIEHIELLPSLTRAIREEKIYLAIDDFGVGYASFSYLLNAETDFLKIDGSIVKEILKSKKHVSLIKAINFMAKELGIKTVAEFVEEEKLADLLYILGVDYLQGFYLAKPMPLEELERLIKKS